VKTHLKLFKKKFGVMYEKACKISSLAQLLLYLLTNARETKQLIAKFYIQKCTA
jgi:hypothetical protein